MQLYCPDCGAAIPAVDINIATGLAKCAACNSVFNFADRITDKAAKKPVEILPRPPQMKVEDWGGVRRISWRWFSWTYVGLLGFCIFWDGFLVFWYTLAFTQHGPLIMKFFPILHVSVGVSLTYSVLTGFFNRTVIAVDDLTLSVQHGPLPWWGNRRLPAGEIDQLFCERAWSKYQNGSQSGPQYQLSATMGEGKKIRLVGGLNHLAEAKFLEQQIEDRLKIKPQAVVGECNE